jgi:hypothetical protein
MLGLWTVLHVCASSAQAQPAYFSLSSPATGAELLTPSAAVFTWQASSGATTYWLEILTNPSADWSTAVRVGSNTTSRGMDPELHSAIAGKQIGWRVQACNAQAQCVHNVGGTRTARIPLLPASLVSPAQQSYTENRRPTFTWRRQSGAQYYKVIVNGLTITTGNGVQGSSNAPAGTTYAFTPTQELQGSYADWHVQSCAMIGGGMLCGPAFNPSQTFRLNFGAAAPAGVGEPFKPDLGPGGTPGGFVPGSAAVRVEYALDGRKANDVPPFARTHGFSFSGNKVSGPVSCGVGFSGQGGFSDALPSVPMSYSVFHLAAAVTAPPMGTTVLVNPRCRFTFFGSKKLQPGWRLKNVSFAVHGGGSFSPWVWNFEQIPTGTDEVATFAILLAGPQSMATIAVELQKLVLEGPYGKSWQDAFRP